MSVVVVGSLNVDYVVRVARFPQPGETLTGSRFEWRGSAMRASVSASR